MIRFPNRSLPLAITCLAVLGLAACDGGIGARKAPSAAELQTKADFDQRIAPSLEGRCTPEVISGVRDVAVLAVNAQMNGDSGAMRNAAAQGQTITANASPACVKALQSIPPAV